MCVCKLYSTEFMKTTSNFCNSVRAKGCSRRKAWREDSHLLIRQALTLLWCPPVLRWSHQAPPAPRPPPPHPWSQTPHWRKSSLSLCEVVEHLPLLEALWPMQSSPNTQDGKQSKAKGPVGETGNKHSRLTASKQPGLVSERALWGCVFK